MLAIQVSRGYSFIMNKEKYVPTEDEIKAAETCLDDSDLTNNVAIGGICVYRSLSEARSKIYQLQNTPNILRKQAFANQLNEREQAYASMNTLHSIIKQWGTRETLAHQEYFARIVENDYLID